jgi:type VII secretion protein EccB
MAWSRRDQIQAHQFLRRRSTSALVLADPNSPESPTRRPLMAALAGAVVLLLVLGGFGVYGLLKPGAAKTWREAGTIVMQKDSGARFVLGDDGRLHPVLNYASARLIVGAEQPKTASVSGESLQAAPRGRVVGIPGAPDALPDLSGPPAQWNVCSRPAPDRQAPITSVVLGGPTLNGVEPGAKGLLVRDQKGVGYLLAQGKRWAMKGDEVQKALGWGNKSRLPVADTWLEAVPAGTDLRPPVVANRGGRVSWNAPPGVRVGQVLKASNVGTATQYYLAEQNGIRALSQTEAALVLGDPKTTKAYGNASPKEVDFPPSAVSNAPPVPEPVAQPDYPQAPPPLVEVSATSSDFALCAVIAQGAQVGTPVTLRLVPASLVTARQPLPIEQKGAGPREVSVQPGRGALVRTAEQGGAVYLVTDQGVRYPVADDESLKALGYGRTESAVVPARLVELLPQGPLLNRDSARQPTTG